MIRSTLALILFLFAQVLAAPPPIATERDISDLMERMSVEEKVGQLTMLAAGRDATGPVVTADAERKIIDGRAGSMLNVYGLAEVLKFQRLAVEKSRLGIPLLFAYDVIHGHRTIFPINLALAASWDLDLVERTFRRAALEAWADGLHWAFAPMVDVTRDPRWGRVSEGAGEDPWLGSRIAEAAVRGFQGSEGNLRMPGRIMATVKHFALYGAPDAGRDYNTVDMSRHRMFNEFLGPYRDGIAAGAGAVMTSFNEVEGIPASGNRWLLRELLRGRFGFHGVVVSDYNAIAELAVHGLGDAAESARIALEAGVDIDMVGECYSAHIPRLIRTGILDEKLLDEACGRVLNAKLRLGLFEDPQRGAVHQRGSDEMKIDRALALEAALKSMVLLKNGTWDSRSILPLRRDERVLFVGPFVRDRHHQLGAWRAAGDSRLALSLADALPTKGAAFAIAEGSPILDNGDAAAERAMLEEAVSLAKEYDKVVALVGEPSELSGEGASKTDIRLPAPQRRLLAALAATGKPLVLVLVTGRPLALAEEEPLAGAILVAWFGGHLAGQALADLLYGDAEPQGRLPISFPRSVGQIPVHYNFKPTGRPPREGERYTSRFVDSPNEPLYPFGYGLSYSRIAYSPVEVDRTVLKTGGQIRVGATLSNVGDRTVTETVQLYIRDLVGSVTRPVRELKGFRQVRLAPGESARVEFEIVEPLLRFYDAQLEFRSEAGEFQAFIGPNSAEGASVKFCLEAER